MFTDLLIVEAKPKEISDTNAVGANDFVEPEGREMALFMGDKQISGAVAEDNGVYSMSIYSDENCFVIGQNIINYG